MHEDRLLDAGLGLELREQAIDVVDVPRTLDLRDHDDVEPVADLAHERREVVEHPRRLERVHARPQLGVAELDVAPDGHQAGARGLLAVDRHGVLEVAEQDVHLRGDVGDLGDHLLVGEVEEVDHPRGPEGNLARGLRGADRERLKKSLGFLMKRQSYAARPDEHRNQLPLHDRPGEREASGAHSYGRYLEEFEVGAVYKHWPAKTVTEADDHLFCLITMNHHPLHINDVYAAKSQQGRNVVVGPLVYSLALGMSVSDVSGKAIANLATEELKHPAPVFHGDTLFVESEVLEKRESQSKPDRGTVKVHTRVFNQDGTLVAEFKRLVLVPRKHHGEPAAAAE